MKSLFELARRLIDVPSETGSEGKIGSVYAEILEERGFTVGFQTVEGSRRNVYAISGEPTVVLCTHMDTVAPHFPSSEDETFIHGRGACDTKGIAAAMIEAATRLRADGVTGFALLFVVGEEIASDGARATADLDWTTHAVVVGEPTENVLASGHKGGLSADLVARGRAAHSGYPELGVSAIDCLLSALHSLGAVDWGQDPVLGAGSLNVGTIEGGVAINVIAPEARAGISVRVVDSADAVEQRLQAALADHPRVELVLWGASDPIQCSTLEGWEARPMAYGTDLPYLAHLGKRFLIGPGSIHDAHTDHERVKKSELVSAVDLYVDLTRRLLDERRGGEGNGD